MTTIKKVALGGDGSFTFFNFPVSLGDFCSAATISAPDYTDITCEDVPTTLGDSTYQVNEAEDAGSLGFTLTNVVCDDSNSSGNVPARRAEIKLEKDEFATCTFTNVRDIGTINIIQSDPTFSDQDFTFTSDLTFDNFCSPDRDPLSDGFVLDWFTNTETCTYVPTWQVFTVTQSPTLGWTLAAIDCEGFATFQIGETSVTIQLLQNLATATCTFTNIPTPPP